MVEPNNRLSINSKEVYGDFEDDDTRIHDDITNTGASSKAEKMELGLFLFVMVCSVTMMFVMLFVRFKMFTIVPFLIST